MKNVQAPPIAIATLLLLTACMTWTRPEPPGTVFAHASGEPIQVARADHSTIEMKDASVVGDSLIGTAMDGSNARVAIPITEITGVAERSLDGGRTAALGGAIILSTLGALFVALIISLSNSHFD